MNRFVPRLLAALACLAITPAFSQTSYFNQGFLRQPSAEADRAYLGITSGGSGTVTNFIAANFPPLFNSSVTDPTTFPHLSFAAISQTHNLVYASPDGVDGIPLFRALVTGDLPAIPSGGSVTNFSMTDLSPLFTTTVATPTTFPKVTLNLSTQSGNTVFAGPSSGAPALPTFRNLVPGDIPNLAPVVRTYFSADPPINYDSSSGNFSMHVADASDDGYLSAADWSVFNAKLDSVTNASQPLVGNSLIHKFTGPVPSFKSLSAGANISITDIGDTNLSISSTTSAAVGSDIALTNMVAFDGQTNFYLDFNWASQVLNATGAIVFNYATNWSSNTGTSRVANVFIPASNYLRHVYFTTAATNWHSEPYNMVAVPCGYTATIRAEVYGRGDTNVVIRPSISTSIQSSNTTVGFNPTNSQGGCILWLDSSAPNALFQDEFGTVPCLDGLPIRYAADLSKTVNRMTNNVLGGTGLLFRNPNNSPGNIPSFSYNPGTSCFLESPTFTILGQTNWAFMVYYGRGSQNAFLDGNNNANRFACIPSESPTITMTLFSGSSLNVTPANNVSWMLFSFFQGVTSVIRTNGIQAASGTSGAQSPTGWVLGSDFSLGAINANINLSELVVYHTNLSNLQVTNIEQYLMNKYGILR